MGRIRVGLVAALIAFAAGTTNADSPKGVVAISEASAKTRLEKGIALYEALEWEDAQQSLTAALSENLSREDAAKAYWYLALIAYAQDNRKDAADALYEMLRANPNFTLPAEYRGSEMEDLFEAAWERTDRVPPQIGLSVPANVHVGERVSVLASIADRSPLETVLLEVTPTGGTPLTVAMKPEGEGWRAEVPESLTAQAGSSLLSVMAMDAWGNVGRQSGRLIVLPRPAEPPAKRGGRGWLYAAGGVFVSIGASVAAYLLSEDVRSLVGTLAGTSPSESEPPPQPETWEPGEPPGPPSSP